MTRFLTQMSEVFHTGHELSNCRIILHTGHELSDYSSHGSRIIELFFTRIITDDHEIFISRDILEKKRDIPLPSLRIDPYNCEEKFDNSGQRNKTVILREKINSKFANYFPLVSGCRGMSRDKEKRDHPCENSSTIRKPPTIKT